MRCCLLGLLLVLGTRGGFRAGAAAVDVTPEQWPVVVNGGFLTASATSATSPIFARALALDDGTTALAICVVDSCMMPRELIDEAKALAAKETGLPTDRLLVSATHTHSAPATMGCLGAPADADYVKFLVPRIARAIAEAHRALAPARAGWAVVPAPEHTNCRQWIRRPDKMLVDPFGQRTVRSNMHPGYESPDVIGPSGPVDPDLSLLSIRTTDGKPLALLGNYSMHYFGAKAVSPDYCGLFCRAIEERHRAENPKFVAILSQGTSGDQHWMDYSKPKKNIGLDEYARVLAELASRPRIEHREDVTLAMAETTLKLRRRVANEDRLAWAKGIADGLGDKMSKNQREVYAREQLSLAAEPERELKLQALRIGELGIATMPNEVFGITGLKVKARSPLATTFTIELANGAEGYIPPPEHHKLGGYTTWAARTAGLEVGAEPKILEAVLGLLEKVSGKPRRAPADPKGPYAEAVLASKPVAYFRMNELDGDPRDLVGQGKATYEDGVVHGLPGPEFAGETNRAAHFAGGRMRTSLKGDRCSVEFWFWNGLPETVRPVTGILMSRGHVLGLGGTARPESAGRLFLAQAAGKTILPIRTWNHVVVSRDGEQVAVYLNGRLEIQEKIAPADPAEDLYVGGQADPASSLEGKIDELALYDRALGAEEAARHYSSAGIPK